MVNKQADSSAEPTLVAERPQLTRLKTRVAIWKSQQALSAQLAKNIKARRRELGMTQLELAILMNTKQPDIARMERTNYGRFHIHRLAKLAWHLQTTVSELTNQAVGVRSSVKPTSEHSTSKKASSERAGL